MLYGEPTLIIKRLIMKVCISDYIIKQTISEKASDAYFPSNGLISIIRLTTSTN
jgi:hypothetical protein